MVARRELVAREPLRVLIDALASTEVGRSFGLRSVRDLAGFRASVPLMDAEIHARDVTGRLGFGQDGLGPGGHAPGESKGEDGRIDLGARERPRLLARWRQRFSRLDAEREPPFRIGALCSTRDDAERVRLRWGDLVALGDGEPRQLAVSWAVVASPRPGEFAPSALLEELRAWGGDTLVLPSLSTCAWLEAHLRAPLERCIPALRWILVEHDFGRRVRTRVPVLNAGWLHAAGRIALPSVRGPTAACCLARDSVHLELLPEGDPLEDPRRRAPQETIAPAHALLGERYELVISSAMGFLRLRSGEHVRVVGFSAPDNLVPGAPLVPRPRVVRLHPPPEDVGLEGVTLAGAWLTASVRQALRPEDPALVAAEIGADPGALATDSRLTYSRSLVDPFAETELGAARHRLARARSRPLALAVRLELQGEAAPGLVTLLSERIDAAIRRRSAAYNWLRARDELWEPRVMLARYGTARAGRQARLETLRGRVESPAVRVVNPRGA